MEGGGGGGGQNPPRGGRGLTFIKILNQGHSVFEALYLVEEYS